MAYKMNKRDGIAIGTICAVALGIVLISNQPNVTQHAVNKDSSPKSSIQSSSQKSKSQSKSEGKTSGKDSGNKDSSNFVSIAPPNFEKTFFDYENSQSKTSEGDPSSVKHSSSKGINITDQTSETPVDNSTSNSHEGNYDGSGTYSEADVVNQNSKKDVNPGYIAKDDPYGNGSEIRPLVIGDWTFIKGNGNGLYAKNTKHNEDNYYELNEPLDWALFNGQLQLSDSDYDKVVRYFNTTKAYIEENDIEINGFGG